MGRPILDALLALGARPVAESGSEELSIDLSVFSLVAPDGDPLVGEGRLSVTGHSLSFLHPPELAAAGTLRLLAVKTVEELQAAVLDVHGRVLERLRREMEVLRDLGFEPTLQDYSGRVRATVVLDGHDVTVTLEDGDLVIEELDSFSLEPAPEVVVEKAKDVPAAEARAFLVKAFEALLARSSGEVSRNANTVMTDMGSDDLQLDVDDPAQLVERAPPPQPGRNDTAASYVPSAPETFGDEPEDGTADFPLGRAPAARPSPPTLAAPRASLRETGLTLREEDDQETRDADALAAAVLLAADEEARGNAQAESLDDGTETMAMPEEPVVPRRPRTLGELALLGDEDDGSGATISHGPIDFEALRAIGIKRTVADPSLDDEEAAAIDNLGDAFDALEAGNAADAFLREPSANVAVPAPVPEPRPDDLLSLAPAPRKTPVSDEPDDEDIVRLEHRASVLEARARQLRARASEIREDRIARGLEVPPPSAGPELAPPVQMKPSEPPVPPPVPANEAPEPPQLEKQADAPREEPPAPKVEAPRDETDFLDDAPEAEAAPPPAAAPPPDAPPPDLQEALRAVAEGFAREAEAPPALEPARTSTELFVPPVPDDADDELDASRGAIVSEVEPDQIEESQDYEVAPKSPPAPAIADLAASFFFDEHTSAASEALATRVPDVDEARTAIGDEVSAREVEPPAPVRAPPIEPPPDDDDPFASAATSPFRTPTPPPPPEDEVAAFAAAIADDDGPPIPPPAAPDEALDDGFGEADADLVELDASETDAFAPPQRVDAQLLERSGALRVSSNPSIERTHFGDGVALSEVQAALGELGEATYVGDAAVETRAKEKHVESSDVFTDSGRSVPSQEVIEPPAFEASPETGSRPAITAPIDSSAAVIALVVEDARALERLNRHLTPCFRVVLPVREIAAVGDVADLATIDALVVVRPARGTSLPAFAQLAALEKRPAVLVVSGDATFDGAVGVDMRIPLGQRPSEVTAQVVAALTQLGVGKT